jgi:NADH dehydrogenase (ubiquinone) 1 alpha/beta subcomplex 1
VYNKVAIRSFSSGGGALDPDTVTQRVVKAISQYKKIEGGKDITPNSNFLNDLGLDSLDQVEVLLGVEDEFSIEIPDAVAEEMKTVGDVIKYVLTNPHAK